MSKLLKRSGTTANGSLTPRAVADERHEKAFEVYRDLGPDRSFRKCAQAVKLLWPANPVAYTTLAGWAQKQGWSKRIEDYENGMRQAQSALSAAPSVLEGDDVAALEKAASQALAAALRATSVAVTRPGDVKALVDTASKALELADKLKRDRTGTATRQEIAAFGAKLLGRIEEARRRDMVEMVKAATEAACREAGTTNLAAVLKEAAAAVGLRVGSDGEIERPETSYTAETGTDAVSAPPLAAARADQRRVRLSERPKRRA
jgi:hypothetical protein